MRITNHETYYDRDRSLLSREIDDLLLHVRGLVLVRGLLAERGASRGELDAHTRELHRLRRRLARLIEGPTPRPAPLRRPAAVRPEQVGA
jgi:hypothetical protein